MRNTLLGLCCLVLLACSAKAKQQTAEQRQTEPVRASDVAHETAEPASGWKAQLDEIDKLVYHFQDSSVPPQYHRSVTLTASAREVEKVVDSYGEIISQEATAIDEAGFRHLVASMEDLSIEQGSESKDELDGCTGGTSDSLTLYVGTVSILAGSVSSCGGGKSGTLRGNVKQLAKNIEALLIPSTDAPVQP